MSGDCGHGWSYHEQGPSGPCSACEREGARTKVLHARIAALEAQNAALAGALQDFVDEFPLVDSDGQEPYCDMQGCIGGKGRDHKHWCPVPKGRAALTADAQHLAQLDAARREVCADMERIAWHNLTAAEAQRIARAALAALAKLEGR